MSIRNIPECGLKVLAEGVVEEGRLGDLAVLVLVQDKLCGLPARVNDQRIPGKDFFCHL